MFFGHYMAELKKVKLLEPAEEAELWHKYKTDNDSTSRRRLIEHYQPLVFRVAGYWRGSNHILMDLVQEGTVGLIEAVENYDNTRGVAFSLYATYRIRGRILNYLEQEGKADWAWIDSPVAGSEEAMTLSELLMDRDADVPTQVEQSFLVEQVKAAMNRLPQKEQLVVSGMLLEHCEPKQLAENLEMSVSHLYRLQKQGIRRMRGMLSRLMHEMKS